MLVTSPELERFRRLARRRLPRCVFDYLEGGADQERCLTRNLMDLHQTYLLPRRLRDVSQIETAVNVFGQRWRGPLAVAPTGLNGLIRPNGDILIAKSCARAGVPFVLSTASNSRLEAVRAAAVNGIQWLQLYVMNDRSIAEQLVRRARRQRFGALVLTVDVPTSGNRVRDVRNGFPFRPNLRALADLALRPSWLLGMAKQGMPRFVNLTEVEDRGAAARIGASLLSRELDRKLVWQDLSWLRRLWDGPLLLKGILHPEDARMSLAQGIDGLIVSNHGGRQLDCAPSGIGALPAIVDAVDGRIPVFVDSGFRSGEDVARALALGAHAVFVGRPVLYGLASWGEKGVDAVLNLILSQLVRTMALVGACNSQELAQLELARGQVPGKYSWAPDSPTEQCHPTKPLETDIAHCIRKDTAL